MEEKNKTMMEILGEEEKREWEALSEEEKDKKINSAYANLFAVVCGSIVLIVLGLILKFSGYPEKIEKERAEKAEQMRIMQEEKQKAEDEALKQRLKALIEEDPELGGMTINIENLENLNVESLIADDTD